ncbi:AraC-like DNA-binding protein [Kribbella aluminosa]|uniref:AraC-like DNA-binding protein n=1 Tax=Kribbella aluminosa TaxID=416017 RepID=A0ABS4UQL0_9ACTN|nr:AraC-like DNA-binding protein [Kribbella aluminosa]
MYAGRGVLAVTTDAGTWAAPATTAIWIPARTLHQHRAYGETTLHTIGLTENPLELDAPTAPSVTPLLRELILTYTSAEEWESPRAQAGEAAPSARLSDAAARVARATCREHGESAERLRLVLLDQLRGSAERPTYLPAGRDPRLVAVCELLRKDPADSRTFAELGRVVGASERTLSRLFKRELGMTFPRGGFSSGCRGR